ENVDLNRDISNFIDPVIQDFIYQNGLYLRDTQNKPMLNAGNLEFQWLGELDPLLLDRLSGHRPHWAADLAAVADRGDQLLLLRPTRTRALLGHISYRHLSQPQLFTALGEPELANRIRLRSSGSVLFITALAADSSDRYKDYTQLLLSELLAHSLERSC